MPSEGGRLRVHALSVSVDGFAAGPDQGPDEPLGAGGMRLHDWVFATNAWRRAHGMEGGDTGVDDRFAVAGEQGIGATIMGRNMFGPVRGDWGAGAWRGWWGDDPPFHHPVFVLTHHPRGPLEMEGGTVFHFVTGGPGEALRRARDAAGGRDVRLGGGAATVRQYLAAGLVDEMHIAIAPVLLGAGERLFEGIDAVAAGYRCAEVVATPGATHVRLERA